MSAAEDLQASQPRADQRVVALRRKEGDEGSHLSGAEESMVMSTGMSPDWSRTAGEASRSIGRERKGWEPTWL